MTRTNVVINCYQESREILKQLAQEEGISMRDVFEKALLVYTQSKGPEARKATLVIDINMFKGSFNATLKMKPYKPWLGRTDTDDLQKMTAEEATAMAAAEREQYDSAAVEAEAKAIADQLAAEET